MYVKTNDTVYPCGEYTAGNEGTRDARFLLTGGTLPETLGETVELYQDDGFLLATQTVADFVRWELTGRTLILTNRPVPGSATPDMDALRSAKLDELSAACKQAITAGCVVTLSNGSAEQFAMEETDQINLTTALAAIQDGAAGYPYHADGQLCRVYPAADILAIAKAATAHKLYHTTYCNHLMAWARRVETAAELEGIFYGTQLPEDLAANMAEVLGNG